MIRNLNIPKNDHGAFVDLIEMSDKDIQDLKISLKSIDYGSLVISELVEVLADKVGKRANILIKLYYTFAQWNLDSTAFLNLIYDAYLNITESQTVSRDMFLHAFKDVIVVNSPIKIKLKADILRSEFDRKIIDTRIITDIRPVFLSNNGDGLSGCIIVHNLRIKIEDSINGEIEQYYSLSADEIDSLIENLQRAKEKAIALQSVVKGTNLDMISI
jgi:hypothetical protein